MTKKCEDGFKKKSSRSSPSTDNNQKMLWFNDMANVNVLGCIFFKCANYINS